jgi:hypothetical protein
MPVPLSISYLVPALCLFRICIIAAASDPYVLVQKKHLKSFAIRVAIRLIVLYLRGPFLKLLPLCSRLEGIYEDRSKLNDGVF